MKFNKHRWLYFISTFFGVYILTWFLLGNKKLAERPFTHQWIQHEIYVNDNSFFDDQFPYPTEVIFVSEYYKYSTIADHNGFKREVITDIDEPKATILLESEKSFLLIYSYRDWPNPFLQFHQFGYWGYGSDHIEIDTEILIWGFIGWIKIISERELLKYTLENKNSF